MGIERDGGESIDYSGAETSEDGHDAGSIDEYPAGAGEPLGYGYGETGGSYGNGYENPDIYGDDSDSIYEEEYESGFPEIDDLSYPDGDSLGYGLQEDWNEDISPEIRTDPVWDIGFGEIESGEEDIQRGYAATENEDTGENQSLLPIIFPDPEEDKDGNKHDGLRHGESDPKELAQAENMPEKNERQEEDHHSDGENTDHENMEKEDGLSPERLDAVKLINKDYYDNAAEVAADNEKGAEFTGHGEAHVREVAEKALDAIYELEKAIEKGTFQKEKKGDPDYVKMEITADKIPLEVSAWGHDTGMDGEGYAMIPLRDKEGKSVVDSEGKKVYEKAEDGSYLMKEVDKNDFDEIRSNHSLNSALKALLNREEYKEAGLTDEQVDEIAVLCMAHSKTNSGLSNLNSKKDWADCFDRIDSAVDAYNKDHPDTPIAKIDRKELEEKLGQVASSAFVLRISDVSRDSGPDAVSQSGEPVHVDRETINNDGVSLEEELKDVKITYGNKEVNSEVSKQVHVGEQNIVENHFYCAEDGSVHHSIKIADGSGPLSTANAIQTHIGEFATAKDGKFHIDVQFASEIPPEIKEIYEQFREKIEITDKYGNVTIHYPWDKEI